MPDQPTTAPTRPVPSFTDRLATAEQNQDDTLRQTQAELREAETQRDRYKRQRESLIYLVDRAFGRLDHLHRVLTTTEAARDRYREQADRLNTERQTLAAELAEQTEPTAVRAGLGSSRRAQAPRLVPYAERQPLYAAYQAAHAEVERIDGELSDESIIQAAVKAYEAAQRAQDSRPAVNAEETADAAVRRLAAELERLRSGMSDRNIRPDPWAPLPTGTVDTALNALDRFLALLAAAVEWRGRYVEAGSSDWPLHGPVASAVDELLRTWPGMDLSVPAVSIAEVAAEMGEGLTNAR